MIGDDPAGAGQVGVVFAGVWRRRSRGRSSTQPSASYVYLPAAYFNRNRPTEHFPVIELLHRYSGSPHNWIGALPIGSMLDQEIAAGRMPAVIALAPKEDDNNDGECVNAVGGEQNETYLAQDVPADIATGHAAASATGNPAAGRRRPNPARAGHHIYAVCRLC